MHTIKVASKNSFWRNKKWLIITLVCVVFAAGILWGMYGREDASALHLAKVERGDLYQRVSVAGSIEPNKSAPISTPYTGYVQKVYVTMGQKVKANDPIVSVSESLLSTDKTFPIRASFPGTVVQIEHAQGDYVRENGQAGESLLVRIDDLSKMFVYAQTPEVDIAKIKVGMETAIRVSAVGDALYKGVVRELSLAAKSSDNWRSRQSVFDVQMEILNPDEKIRPGMSAVADIVTAKFENVLYLPSEYVYQDGENYFVVDRAGRRRPVEVGNQTEMAYEIKSGLKEGDEVRLVDFLKVLENGNE